MWFSHVLQILSFNVKLLNIRARLYIQYNSGNARLGKICVV